MYLALNFSGQSIPAVCGQGHWLFQYSKNQQKPSKNLATNKKSPRA
jgi:hypothetical protein